MKSTVPTSEKDLPSSGSDQLTLAEHPNKELTPQTLTVCAKQPVNSSTDRPFITLPYEMYHAQKSQGFH